MGEESKAAPSRHPARVIGGFALAALGVALIVWHQQVGAWTYHQQLTTAAVVLVDDALEGDQGAFLVVSGIKAAMALIEGSTVGVGVEVQLGDVIQPAYDYIDFFWHVFLWAFFINGFYKLLLETGLLELGFALMGAGLVGLAVPRITAWRERDLRAAGRRFVLLGALVAYIVPAALLSTHWLSQRYTGHLKEKHQAQIQVFERQLDTAQNDLLALRTQLSVFRPGESMDEIRKCVGRVTDSVGAAFRESFMAFLFYMLLILFDLLFFPLMSALVLYKFAAMALNGAVPKPPVIVLGREQASGHAV